MCWGMAVTDVPTSSDGVPGGRGQPWARVEGKASRRAAVRGDLGSESLILCNHEPPQTSAPGLGTPNEGLLGSRACLSVSGLLAFAAVLRDKLF